MLKNGIEIQLVPFLLLDICLFRCIQEWHKGASELYRELGLFGPEYGSELDKFELDITEGSGHSRVRKKLIPDVTFYQRYPFR